MSTLHQLGYVHDADFDARLDVDLVHNEHGDPTVCFITIVDDTTAVGIGLAPHRVTELRKLLQRVERKFR